MLLHMYWHYTRVLGGSKKHCMFAGYKNCKFEQGWPACLITSCTATSENTEWCNRQQCLCGNFLAHLESLTIEMFHSWLRGIISTQHHRIFQTSNPGGCFESIVQIWYFTSFQYQTDVRKHQSKNSRDFGEWQVTKETMTTVLQ